MPYPEHDPHPDALFEMDPELPIIPGQRTSGERRGYRTYSRHVPTDRDMEEVPKGVTRLSKEQIARNHHWAAVIRGILAEAKAEDRNDPNQS